MKRLSGTMAGNVGRQKALLIKSMLWVLSRRQLRIRLATQSTIAIIANHLCGAAWRASPFTATGHGVYRQIRKRLKSGESYLDDSLQHRSLTDEFVSLDEKANVLSQMDTSWLHDPIHTQVDELTDELHTQWLAFDRELR